eukprot:866382-Pleurochrysis_carterae.AAC.3
MFLLEDDRHDSETRAPASHIQRREGPVEICRLHKRLTALVVDVFCCTKDVAWDSATAQRGTEKSHEGFRALAAVLEVNTFLLTLDITGKHHCCPLN